MSSAIDRLAKQLLADRERAKIREPTERREPVADPIGFDPYDYGKLVSVTGGDIGYMPSSPMRKGASGFFVACRACGGEFESKGLAYCPACMKIPAEERRAMTPAFTGRLCQAPGCENFIPRKARADTRFCSDACSKRARREQKNVRDNRDRLPDSPPPQNVRDNGEKC